MMTETLVAVAVAVADVHCLTLQMRQRMSAVQSSGKLSSEAFPVLGLAAADVLIACKQGCDSIVSDNLR